MLIEDNKQMNKKKIKLLFSGWKKSWEKKVQLQGPFKERTYKKIFFYDTRSINKKKYFGINLLYIKKYLSGTKSVRTKCLAFGINLSYTKKIFF